MKSFQLLLVPLFLTLSVASAIAPQPSIENVIATNLVVEQQVVEADQALIDVNVVNATNVVKDLQTLNQAIKGVQGWAKGVTPTKKPEFENELTSGFVSFSAALSKYLADLENKQYLLDIEGQKQGIYNALVQLFTIAESHAQVIQDLVTSQTFKDTIANAAGDTYDELVETKDAFD